jgi:hypothetical protein
VPPNRRKARKAVGCDQKRVTASMINPRLTRRPESLRRRSRLG